MASKQNQDPIKYILSSPVSSVLIKGFAELYKSKPEFPIGFLGKWLKQYSQGQKKKTQLQSTKTSKQEKIIQFQNQEKQKHEDRFTQSTKLQDERKMHQTAFIEKVECTKYLADLLTEYFPEAIFKNCTEKGTPLTGCYVGELTYRKKKLEEHNFQPNGQFDTESPKIIEYIGASKSHKFMIGQILPNEAGRSYQVFKDEEPQPQDAQQGKPVNVKKKYLSVPLVHRDEKMHFFKFPRLGSFACFPLKIKSCLSAQAFDKGVGDYKNFVKNKQEIEKQYNQKASDAKANYEQAKRKFEQHEGNEQDPAFQSEHALLEQQYKKNEQILRDVESNAPVIEPFTYETKQKNYIVSVDTLGKDIQINEPTLNYIEHKVNFFKEKWEHKEYKMLLEDILQYLEEEHTLESLDSYFKDQERNIIISNEGPIKEQFVNRQKQAEYELTLLKCSKLLKILQETAYINSLNVYLGYNLPKYTQIIQIVLMMLGRQKQKINLPKTNSLDYRVWIKKNYIDVLLADLQRYQLRRQSSQAVSNEYKINKLLQRLEKIDSEAVGRYNSWLYALLTIAKQFCWARIQCRDAKIQIYEIKIKAKNQRDAEIEKYIGDLDKNLQTAKAQLTEEMLPNFSEQQWLKNYASENVKPEALFVDELNQFHDIQ